MKREGDWKMSLCPDYCDCPDCKHGTKTCLFCSECKKEYEYRQRQQQHCMSVKKQQSKIKPLDRSNIQERQ